MGLIEMYEKRVSAKFNSLIEAGPANLVKSGLALRLSRQFVKMP
jgi:hypothetical protein